MAAKIKWDRGAWWVFTHYDGRRKKKRIGPTKADKRRAERIAEKIDAKLVLVGAVGVAGRIRRHDKGGNTFVSELGVHGGED